MSERRQGRGLDEVCEYPGCGRRAVGVVTDGAVRTRQLPSVFACGEHNLEEVVLEKLYVATADLLARTAGLGGRIRASRNRLKSVVDELESAF